MGIVADAHHLRQRGEGREKDLGPGENALLVWAAMRLSD